MPRCSVCSRGERVKRWDDRLLEGDTFYDYYCTECSKTPQGTFERHPLSWQTVIHLALYHLTRTAKNDTRRRKNDDNVPFFRWKEDICNFIERRWQDLIPGKNPGVSWQNSISSVLSAHHEIFQNGLEVKGEMGWWALKAVEPPKNRSHLMTQSTVSLPRKGRLLEKQDADEQLEIRSEAGSLDLGLEADPEDQATSVSVKEEQQETASMSAEMIKKQLLSRLLSEDSSLIQAALSKVRSEQPPSQPIYLPKTPSTRAPPVENELMRILQRIKNPDAKLRRLRRKLINRRERRRAGLPLTFDLDFYIYNYLKDPKPFGANGERITDTVKPEEEERSNVSKLIQVQTPYQADPMLSIKVRLMGVSNCFANYPTPIISSYSGRTLPPYILRSEEAFSMSKRGPLLEAVKSLRDTEFPDACDVHHPVKTVDIMYLRPEFVPAANRLLSRHFFPGLDCTEAAMDFPDLTAVAVYNRLLVIGVTVLTPDGYLEHLVVHPEWRGAGIARLLLSSVFKNAPPRDITLHVSATSPAMLLYNSLGFKPETFCAGYYERHMRLAATDEESSVMSDLLPYSRHAFLMRLKKR